MKKRLDEGIQYPTFRFMVEVRGALTSTTELNVGYQMLSYSNFFTNNGA